MAQGETVYRRLGLSAAVAIGLLGVAFAQPASAQVLASLPDASSIGRLDPNGSARPVAAWNRFCDRNPSECAIDPSEPATVNLTGHLWKALNAVNAKVNRTIKPKTDMEHWGVVDQWDIPTDGYGDCEDYQLLKRKLLAEQYDVPRRAMRMTVVIDEQGEGHAVLMVRTNEGDLILDNKRSGILPWNTTGYVFIKREGSDGRDWVSLGERSSPVTTANR